MPLFHRKTMLCYILVSFFRIPHSSPLIQGERGGSNGINAIVDPYIIGVDYRPSGDLNDEKIYNNDCNFYL